MAVMQAAIASMARQESDAVRERARRDMVLINLDGWTNISRRATSESGTQPTSEAQDVILLVKP